MQKKLRLSKSTPKDWCVIHWLGGEVKIFGTEKECKAWAKKNSFNPNAPIYYAFPVAGIVIHNHKHEHTHIEKSHTKKKVSQPPKTL
jgi:hypothetical protein